MTQQDAFAEEVTFAAGLLTSEGYLTSSASQDQLRDRLRDVLTSSLWIPGRQTDDTVTGLLARPPQWRPPDFELVEQFAPALRAAWQETIELEDVQDAAVLRVTVDSVENAAHLSGWTVSNIRLVPSVATPARVFRWRWPLRLGVAQGTKTDRWLDELRSDEHYGALFEAQVQPMLDRQSSVEIYFCDKTAEWLAAEFFNPHHISCVMVVGDQSSDQLLELALWTGATIAAGIPTDDVRWFHAFLDQLARDRPLDVALAMAVPDALVACPPGLINITGVGHWAKFFADSSHRADLVESFSAMSFESIEGAYEVVETINREVPAGSETAVVLNFLMSAPGAEAGDHLDDLMDDEDGEPPSGDASDDVAGEESLALDAPFDLEDDGHPDEVQIDAVLDVEAPEGESARQLLAQMFRDGTICQQSLAPGTKHMLSVRIALPRAGEVGIPFPEDKVPGDETGVANLVVDVSSEDGSFHGTAPMILPTSDRARPSTTAGFEVTTGDEGSILQLKITILYQGRPIQAGLLLATVRSSPLPNDEIQFFAVPLSAPREPRPMTAADVTLEDNGVTLANLGTDQHSPIPLTGNNQWAQVFEQEASQVLGDDYAPGTIDDPLSVELLIRLARKGRRFADTLADLGLRDARTIAVLVRFNAPVLPLELAYDGTAPDLDAKLCDCVQNRARPPTKGCRRTSSKTVCPYAFWGMNRVIARTVKGRPVERLTPRTLLSALSLRPVLYAAAQRADNGSPPDALPSKRLEDALKRSAGDSGYARVKNWDRWRRAVKKSSPQLLVVLGHTDSSRGEAKIEIGQQSWLSQPSISLDELGAANKPAPVILLFACDSAVVGDVFGPLPGTFIDKGAAAVVATLTKFKGQHAAEAAVATVSAIYKRAPRGGLTLGTALLEARRELVARGLLVGLLLVVHGEIDVELAT